MSLISVVVPVYFNAASLPALAARLDCLAADQPRHNFEFIYVDDGSGDDSFAVIQRLAERDPRVRGVKLARNFGSNTAILAGIAHARGDCVAFVAADLQDPPETLVEMIALWEAGTRVVLAERRDRLGDPWSTRLFAGVFNWLFKKLVFKNISPQGVGFFLVDRLVANVLIQCQEKNAHLIGLILWTGFAYRVVSYERVEREHGRSRWTFAKKVKYFIDAFVAFSYLPLRVASTLGIVLAGGGSLYALLLLILRLAGVVQVEGWTALMVVVLVISGVQLLMLGMIGEYLWRGVDASRQRPIFIVEQVVGQEAKSDQGTGK